MPHQLYRVNHPTVSAESFDNEVIIIHFGNGNYFSLDAFGTRVWNALEAGVDKKILLQHLAEYYDAGENEIESALDRLLEQLLVEDLVLKTEGKPAVFAPEIPEKPAEFPQNAGTLLKFDDMQELLLLDPIHDVDEAGWPNSRNTGQGPDE